MSDDVTTRMRAAIESALPGAKVDIKANGGGHYALAVVSSAFEGKTTLQRHRLVLSAIAPLMSGNDAPVHAVDSLDAKTP